MADIQHSQRQPPSPPNQDHARLRPLQFWHGATLTFQVLECINKLQSELDRPQLRPVHDIDDQIAMLYDANAVLQKAHNSTKSGRRQDVNHEYLQKLEATRDAFKAAFSNNAIRRLMSLPDSRPEEPMNDAVVEDWYQRALSFLNFSEVLENGSERDRSSVRSRITATYQDCLRIVEQRGRTGRRPLPARSVMPSSFLHNKIKDLLDDLSTNTDLSGSGVNRLCETITDIYRHLCQILLLPDEDPIRHLDAIVHIFCVVEKEFQRLLVRPDAGDSLKNRYLDQIPDILCQGWNHRLISVARPSIIATIVNGFQKLQEGTANQADRSCEVKFSQLVQFVLSVSFPTPVDVCSVAWPKYIPRTLSVEECSNFMNKLQYMHAQFQQKTYSSDEQAQLWLAIWHGLKAIYLILRQHRFHLEMPDFPVEGAFFTRSTVLDRFEQVLSAPEAARPAEIENLVAEYCILIAQKRDCTDSVFGMLKQIQDTRVTESIFKHVHTLAESLRWSDIAIRAVEKCAIRLNSIIGGPAFFRRWNRNPAAANIATDQWIVERPQPDVVPQPTVSHGLNSRTEEVPQPRQSLPSVPPTTLRGQPQMVHPNTGRFRPEQCRVAEESPFDVQRLDLQQVDAGGQVSTNFPEPVGIEVDSAFDYAAYPFPETRAIEVAQSRQTTREMSQSSIYSQGPRVQDVVNKPPRHTWPLGTISYCAPYMPTGPLDVLSELWKRWRYGRPKTKALVKSKNRPAITPRTPRREWLAQHPRSLQPRKDRANRIAKPPAHHVRTWQQVNHDHHNHIPRLRGGGAGDRLGNTGAIDPLQASASDSNGLNADNRRSLTQQLEARLRTRWQGGNFSSHAYLQRDFLIPSAWDVDVAYTAAIRSLNLDSDVPTTNLQHPITHTNVPQASVMQTDQGVPTNDPIVDPDTTSHSPSVGPSEYRLFSRTNSSSPYGRHGHRLPASSPSPPVRRRRRNSTGDMILDRMLPAHRVLSPYRNARIGTQLFETRPAQTLFTTQGLPADINIWEDPSSRGSPVPQQQVPTSQLPAPNQDHQHQIDRQQQGLPARQADDNSSDQENHTPVPRSPPRQNPFTNNPAPAPGPPRDAQGPVCGSGVCHPCPVYSGLFHHVCPTQDAPNPPISGPPAPGPTVLNISTPALQAQLPTNGAASPHRPTPEPLTPLNPDNLDGGNGSQHEDTNSPPRPEVRPPLATIDDDTVHAVDGDVDHITDGDTDNVTDGDTDHMVDRDVDQMTDDDTDHTTDGDTAYMVDRDVDQMTDDEVDHMASSNTDTTSTRSESRSNATGVPDDINGHRLRNRNGLRQQRAQSEQRRLDFETSQTASSRQQGGRGRSDIH